MVYFSTQKAQWVWATFCRVLGKELRKARLAAGLTQEELASKARLSREYVNYLEKEKRSPTLHVFVRLCRAMRVSASTILAKIEDRL
jgi:transcriptional regulator with XRE-family HTH domain